VRPRPAGSRQWPRRDDRPADVERLIAEHAANAVAHILEDGTPQPGGDPSEMRAHALEQAKRAVEAGRVCCPEGRTVYCVCRNSVKCPRHFPSGVCVGSHD
jgi:hypothetical protein